MIIMAFYNTVEFYVIVTIVAAAVIAFASMPERRGEVILHLLAGEMFSPVTVEDEAPSIAVTCLDDGRVEILRRGVKGVLQSGAVSLAVKQNGYDLLIEERLTRGNHGGYEVSEARFVLDFLAEERYHVKYNSEETGRMAAFTLHNRPGIKMLRELR